MIELVFNRCQPIIDSVTNNVKGFVVGALATDPATSNNAYIDIEAPVPEPLKPLAEWTSDEIREFCLSVAVENNWYSILGRQIDAMATRPTIGSNITI